MSDIYNKIALIAGKDDNIINIPILIICFNNFKYIKMMVSQIEKKNYNQPIIILNNNSDCIYTQEYLKLSKHIVINLNENMGHLVWKMPEIYNNLPNQFIITDPDIEFNNALPNNYIEILVELSNKYNASVIGFALDISDKEKMLPYKFSDFGYPGISTIWEAQQQYWTNKISDESYELYLSAIDTTFALHTKSYINNRKNIRIAGNFTAKHLPWYKYDDNISLLGKYLMYKNSSSSISSIKGFTLKFIEEIAFIINKNGTPLLFEKGVNDIFWRDIYTNWEKETFEVFDKFLNKDKQFLDIGAWMGTTVLYASFRSSYIVAVECDIVSVEKLKNNIILNKLDTVIDIEPYAIYSENTEVSFGPNSFANNSSLNDSMSQIKIGESNKNDYLIKTITLDNLIQKYNLNNLSLIKVDIEGGEENILVDLFNYGKSSMVPLYISFHYSWWNNKNLDRFTFLTHEHKLQIIRSPFCSILFEFN